MDVYVDHFSWTVASIFLNGFITFIIVEDVGPKFSNLLDLTFVTGVAHEDVVAIIERLRKLA